MKDEVLSLPINACKIDLLDAIVRCETCIIVSGTGTGKTTQIPQFLVQDKRFGQRVCVTQPRRVAAISIATRVAEEMSCKLGELVGYRVRFQEKISGSTKLRYETDGMLVREAIGDPVLKNYSVIILDEAHERSIHTDLLFSIVKRAQQSRKNTKYPLRVVIMSATLDIDLFLKYFSTKETKLATTTPKSSGFKNLMLVDKLEKYTLGAIHVEGSKHKVNIQYSECDIEDYCSYAVQLIIKLHILLQDKPGDVLVFLTGQEEIELSLAMLINKIKTLKLLLRGNEMRKIDKTQHNDNLKFDTFSLNNFSLVGLEDLIQSSCDLICLPLYSALPQKEQMKVFEKFPSARKVIFSTNIAETSLTIPGIKIVIDCGLVKVKNFNAGNKLSTLKNEWISKEQAWQRSGRAGRECDGICFRLYTELRFLSLPQKQKPEMQRVDVSELALQLLAIQQTQKESNSVEVAIGGDNIFEDFDILEKPSTELIASAYSELLTIGAVEKKLNLYCITELGLELSTFPLSPSLSRLLLLSLKHKCSEEILTIVSMLSVEPPFIYKNTHIQRDDKSELTSLSQSFAHKSGDHITLLNVFNAFSQNGFDFDWCVKQSLKFGTLQKANQVRSQIRKLLLKHVRKSKSEFKVIESCGDEFERILKCIIDAYPLQVAQQQLDEDFEDDEGSETEFKAENDNSFSNFKPIDYESINYDRLKRSQEKIKAAKKAGFRKPEFSVFYAHLKVEIHPTSVLFSKFSSSCVGNNRSVIIFNEIIQTSKQYLRCVSVVEESWILELSPPVLRDEYIKIKNETNVIMKAAVMRKNKSEAKRRNILNRSTMCD